MTNEIHPLQDKAHSVVTALYADLHLPPRAAIAAYSNRQYPTLEEIFDTLETYKDVDLVKAFSDSHAEIIFSAKAQIEELKKPIPTPLKMADIPFDASSFPDFVNAYDCIKRIPLQDIETALSDALSKVCKEHLLLEITSTNTVGRDVELSVKIKPKQLISEWNDDAKDASSPAN